MVERQAYQIKQLQRSGQQAQPAPSQSYQAPAVQTAPEYSQGANPSTNAADSTGAYQVPIEPTANTYVDSKVQQGVDAAPTISNRALSGYEQGQETVADSTRPTSTPSTPPTANANQLPADNQGTFYQPYSAGSAAQGTPVEERQVNQAGPVVISRPNQGGIQEGDVAANPNTTYSARDLQSEAASVDQTGGSVVPTATNQAGVVNLPSAAPVVSAQAIPSAATSVPDAAPTVAPRTILAEQDYYQQGFDLLKQSEHEKAINVFNVQLTNYPKGDLADDANYWIAESMYVNRELDMSKQFFKTIIDDFSQSPRLPDAMLKTAYIEQEQGNQIEARILLQEIVQYHPRSNAAISAKNRLDDLN